MKSDLKQLPLKRYNVNWHHSFLFASKQRMFYNNYYLCNWKVINKGNAQGSVTDWDRRMIKCTKKINLPCSKWKRTSSRQAIFSIHQPTNIYIKINHCRLTYHGLSIPTFSKRHCGILSDTRKAISRLFSHRHWTARRNLLEQGPHPRPLPCFLYSPCLRSSPLAGILPISLNRLR